MQRSRARYVLKRSFGRLLGARVDARTVSSHRRYWPPPAQSGCLGRQKAAITEETKPVNQSPRRNPMFASVQILRRIGGLPLCADRSDRRLPLRSEHFPVQARDREIITQQGVTIATAADAAM